MKPPLCLRCQSAYSLGVRDTSGQRGQRDYGKHPLLLRCGHTFCRPCLRKCESSDNIRCPTCQKETEADARDLKPDMYTVGLLWARRLQLEHQSEMISADNRRVGKKKATAGISTKPENPCVECDINAANCQCLKCESVLCRSCFDRIHQSSVSLRRHRPVPLQSSGLLDLRMQMQKTISRNCRVHEQCQIEYFCKDDNQLICSRCVIWGDHKGHDVQTLEDKNKESLDEMDPAILTAQETIWRLEKSEQAIKQAMPPAQVDTSSIVEEVRLHFRELHSLLQAREEQLVEDVKEASQSATKPFQETISFLQNEKMMLEMALADATRAKQGSLHNLVDADQILERLRKARDLACVVTVEKNAVSEPIKYSFDTAMKDVIGSYGTVTTKSATQMLTLSVPGPDADKPRLEELHSVTLSDLDCLSTDTESIADTASVSVEEEREEESGAEEGTVKEEIKAEAKPSLPDERLKLGYTEKVRLTHVRTPDQFYVQLGSRRSDLETLQRQINIHCRNLHDTKVDPDCVQQGSAVLAQFSQDKNWYRAVITKVTEPGEGEEKRGAIYDVFFMDYGNSETVTINKLRPMKKKFESQPVFAYECKLFNVLPANRNKGWTLQSVNVIVEMTSFGTILMKVMESGEGALGVDLIKQETFSQCVDDRPVCVSDTLVFLELAVFSKHPCASPGCPRKDFITLPTVSEGCITDIGINCVDSPSAFFAQMQTNSASTYMQKQLMNMQDTYSTHDKRHRYTIFCPKKDMICAAKYHRDNRWYRARIMGLPGQGQVQVYFVDFGNTEIVDHTDVCKILQDYVKFPQQAFRCCLVDVEPTDNGHWSQEALEWFRKTADLQFGQMRIVGPQGKWNTMSGVLYLFSQENKLCSVNYELVQRGFAHSTGPWSLSESFDRVTLVREVKKRTPPRKTFPSPQKVDKSLPMKDAACRTVTPNKTRNTPTRMEEEEEEMRNNRVGVEVIISGYKSPGHFHMQLQEAQSDLLSLMTELAWYETTPPTDRAWKVGEFCMARYSKDSKWYRAQITKQLEEDTYQVMLVDYGTVDILAASELRMMKKAHASKKCFAERCYLAGLLPTGPFGPDKWSAAAIDFMADEICSKRLFLKLERVGESDQGLAVDILIEKLIPETALDPMRHEYVSLVSCLQQEGLATPVNKMAQVESDSTPAGDLHTPDRVHPPDLFHSKISLPFSTSSSPSSIQMEEGETAESPDSAHREETDTGDSANNTSPVAEEEEEEEKEEEEEIEQADCSIPPHPPPLSTTITVFPVYVDYKGIIYAHDQSEEEKNEEILRQIDSYARTGAPKGQLKVKVGQNCLAHFNTDNAWYRARVLDISQSSVKVKYIDFGNTSHVDRSLLRMISPELCAHPQIAYEFKLHNLKPETTDGSWPTSFLEYMHSQLVNTHCTAFIKGDRGQHCLEANIVSDNRESIGDILLKSGVVSKENDMLDLYERYADISDILKQSNPYIPVQLGDNGNVFSGLVTHMELPNMVYIQRCAAPPDNSLPDDVGKFIQMMDDLNDDLFHGTALEEVPAAGKMCCARFSEDQRWYRALVAKTYPPSDTALVFYVDYGNSEVVPLDRLQTLPDKFQDTPAQALRAYLNLGLPDSAERWTLNTYKAMAEAIFLRRHVVLVKHKDPLAVELFSEDQQMNGAAVLSYQTLLSNGLVTLPKPIVKDVDDDNVIVESYTEMEHEDSSVDPAQD